jgi:hypothetical protein
MVEMPDTDSEELFVSDMQRIHCQLCGQTFLTTPGESQACDFCGKSGGLVSSEVVEAQRRLEPQRLPQEKPRKKGFSVRQTLGSLFGLMVLMGTWFTFSQKSKPFGYTWFYEFGLIAIGAVGSAVVWFWPKRKEPMDKS